MAKRWSDEEKAVMRKHYETAESVDDVAKMLGRPKLAVIKKGLAMGLVRPNLHLKSVSGLLSVLGDIPMSSVQIAEELGMKRNSVCEVLRCAHEDRLCHIARYEKRGGRGKDVPLWVAGEGENAMTDAEIEAAELEARRAEHAAKPFKPFRDPFVAAFFGAPA